MALANYSDLLASAASWMSRSDMATILPDCVSIFEARVNRTLRVRQMETTTSLTTTSGVANLPADFLEARRLYWAGSTTQELSYLPPGAFRLQYPIVQSGVPSQYTVEGSSIVVGDYDDTSPLALLYYASLPALASTTTNWLMTAHPDFYLAGTLVEAYAFTMDYDKASAWRAREDDIRTQILMLDVQTRLPASSLPVESYTP